MKIGRMLSPVQVVRLNNQMQPTCKSAKVWVETEIMQFRDAGPAGMQGGAISRGAPQAEGRRKKRGATSRGAPQAEGHHKRRGAEAGERIKILMPLHARCHCIETSFLVVAASKLGPILVLGLYYFTKTEIQEFYFVTSSSKIQLSQQSQIIFEYLKAFPNLIHTHRHSI